MPPIGPADVAPVWGWPDAVVGLVLAVSFCLLVVRTVPWLRRRGTVPGRARGIDRAPVGLGLFLALLVTLLVRGHPDQQVLVGVTALVTAGAVSVWPVLVTRGRRGTGVTASPP